MYLINAHNEHGTYQFVLSFRMNLFFLCFFVISCWTL